MSRPIINIDCLEFMPWSHGEKFEAKIGTIGFPLGARKLGYNLTVVPPGKTAFPFHKHYVNEEMFFVIEGNGEVRIGEEVFPIRQGDVIAHPAGDAEAAHQIVNTSEAELKYLSVSTQISPELVYYPDSDKYANITYVGPDEKGDVKRLFFVNKETSEIKDYWEGEDSSLPT